MALTPAQRSRRSRAHRAGNHDLCDPERCKQAPRGPAAREAGASGTPPVPPGLGQRGGRLWQDSARPDHPPGALVLLEEACRTADRLDRLDALLRGTSDRWLELAKDEAGGRVIVVVDKALSEGRQQQLALKQLLAEHRQQVAPPASAPVKGVQPSMDSAGAPAVGEVAGVVNLAAAAARIRAQASGGHTRPG